MSGYNNMFRFYRPKFLRQENDGRLALITREFNFSGLVVHSSDI